MNTLKVLNHFRIKRRDFLARGGSVAALTALADSHSAFASGVRGPHQATGIRIGEVTSDSAVVWTRLTRDVDRNSGGVVIPGRAADYKGRSLPEPDVPVDELEGACPAVSGWVRLRYGMDNAQGEEFVTDWYEVRPSDDGIRHFALSGLKPGSVYYVVSECALSPDDERGSVVRGRFRTAPSKDAASAVRFCVMTCQGYPDRGHPDGHGIYPSMLELDPDFACLTGDLVYYDNDMPRATSARLARYHWERMFSLPRLREFTRQVSTYWLKDDHDTLNNDSWPGQKAGRLTFEEGQRIFREQAPLGNGTAFRTFRWGRDVQVWFTEGRDFRTPNNRPDGADKTILGAEQKAWLKHTLLESDATWKILVTPTPYIGPDRPAGKSDNHANKGFQHEGDEMRAWFSEHVKDSLFIVCGDRHWQYHSVHPATGLHEFSVGAASDEHAGGSPGEDPRYHRFHRIGGGFLSVQTERNDGLCSITLRHHDVGGKVRYELKQSRQPS